jgi:hypothetical protein
MFKFGWLTVTARRPHHLEAISCRNFHASAIEPSEDGGEYRLGSFDMGSQS